MVNGNNEDGPSTSRGARPTRRTRSSDVNSTVMSKPKKERGEKKKSKKHRKGDTESRKVKREEKPAKKRRNKPEVPRSNGHQEIEVKVETPSSPANMEAVVDAAPPKWLTEMQPRRSPYFPQQSDILQYFPQGHIKYNEAANTEYAHIAATKVKKNKPWDLRGFEMGVRHFLFFEIFNSVFSVFVHVFSFPDCGNRQS